jgi:hypothetical protein
MEVLLEASKDSLLDSLVVRGPYWLSRPSSIRGSLLNSNCASKDIHNIHSQDLFKDNKTSSPLHNIHRSSSHSVSSKINKFDWDSSQHSSRVPWGSRARIWDLPKVQAWKRAGIGLFRASNIHSRVNSSSRVSNQFNSPFNSSLASFHLLNSNSSSSSSALLNSNLTNTCLVHRNNINSSSSVQFNSSPASSRSLSNNSNSSSSRNGANNSQV